MANQKPATVLFVEDDEAELRPLCDHIRQESDAVAEILAPEEVELADLEKADLVVVDYNLGDWMGSVSELPLSARPPNGVAVASVLREQVAGVKAFPPTGFALITGKSHEISRLPSEQRAHVISRLSNLEWFFEKQAGVAISLPIISLAKAVKAIPKDIRELGQIELLAAFLGVRSDDILLERYSDAVHRCRPPIHNLGEQSHGIAIIRWLLHRILPHASFLIDRLHLAARLGIRPASLDVAQDKEARLVKALGPYEYIGPLADFDGKRWWAEGIEQWLWEITNQNSDDLEAVHTALSSRGIDLERVALRRPVVTIDADFRPEADFADFESVVAVSLDDWPSYAQPAYMRKELVREHPNLAMYVELSDRAAL
jgi:hypothetical protein